MSIEITSITRPQFAELLAREEGHFLDFKSKAIAAAKMTKTLSAFANADGGELFLGVVTVRQRRPTDGTASGMSKTPMGTSKHSSNFFRSAPTSAMNYSSAMGCRVCFCM